MPFPFDLVGSLVGGAASIFGQAQYNKQQRQLAEQANAQQMQMFHESQQFNRQERLDTQQYNRQLMEEQMRYNSPYAQANRLRAAGLNPLNVMGSDAGNLQSIPQSSAATSPAAPQVHLPNQNTLISSADINNIVSSVSNLMQTREDVKGKKISNEFAMARERANIDKTLAEKRNLLASAKLSRAERVKVQTEVDNLELEQQMLNVRIDREQKAYEYDDQMFSSMVRQYQDEHQESVLTQQAQKLANDIQRKFGLKLTERQYQLLGYQCQHLKAEMALLSAQYDLTDQEFRNAIEKNTEMVLKNSMLGIDEKRYSEVKQYIIDSMLADTRSKNAAAGYNEFKTSALGVGLQIAPWLIGGSILKGPKLLKGVKNLFKGKPKVKSYGSDDWSGFYKQW